MSDTTIEWAGNVVTYHAPHRYTKIHAHDVDSDRPDVALCGFIPSGEPLAECDCPTDRCRRCERAAQ